MATANNSFRKLLGLLRLEQREITQIYLFSVLGGLIQLSIPLGVQSILVFVLGASVRVSMVIMIVLVVAGVILSGLLQINQMKLIERIQQKLFVRYSFAFMAHLPALDLKKNDRVSLPELTNRFFEIPLLQKGLAKVLLDLPGATIQILLGIILLSLYNAGFILFGFLLVALLAVILKFSGRLGLQTSLDESGHKYRTAAWLQQTVQSIKSFKLAKKNDLHLRKLDQLVSDYLKSRASHFKALLFQYNILVLFKGAIIAAMLIVGTLMVINQQLTLGQFVASEIIILMVLASVEKLIMNIDAVYDTLTALEKISGILEKPLESQGRLEIGDPDRGMKIEMKNLSFSYGNRGNVLNNLTFSIEPNEVVCIRGKDSSGKSTLLKVLAGMYTDFEGSYLLDDIPVANYNLDSIRSRTGVMMIGQQDLFHGSIWDNLVLGNDNINRDNIQAYAIHTGLSEFVSGLPSGYDTIIDPATGTLSQGSIRSILLVRALINKPRLLLLEEPWVNNIDPASNTVMQLLLDQQRMTIIVITSDPIFATHCDQVIDMAPNGTISILRNKTR